MIDTHCHLHDARFDDDRAAAIARARDAGIARMISVGCDVEDSRRALATANEFDLFASAGIHPHEAQDVPADYVRTLREFAASQRVVAIGEAGLDYYYNHSPHEDQLRVLREQLALARELQLPVIFHQRDAFDDFVGVLRESFEGMRGVVHCFTGDPQQAELLVRDFGLKLGIGGVLTFKTAQQLRDAVVRVGLDALVLETDAPYLAPIPMRGKRNEPAFVPYVAKMLAELFGVDPEMVEETTSRAASELFAI
ncbi:MAG TPA: TatD family hydrolase [Candidatus Tumulicola sp.]